MHEALNRKTGIKDLKVRGIKAVTMAVFFKVTGWNICAAAKIALARHKKVKKAAGHQNKRPPRPRCVLSPPVYAAETSPQGIRRDFLVDSAKKSRAAF